MAKNEYKHRKALKIVKILLEKSLKNLTIGQLLFFFWLNQF